jgi:hypothetical protein
MPVGWALVGEGTMKKLLVCLLAFTCLASACGGQAAQGAEQGPAAEPVAASPGPPQPIDLGPVVYGTAPDNPYSADQIERGRALVVFGGCNDCHTPWTYDPELGGPAPMMDRMLSGHPHNAPDPYGTPDPRDTAVIGPTFTSFAFPFGVTYTLNLTPDIDTGTGSWTEEMFLNIFRHARHLGGEGRTIMPPMPWPNVASLPDEDIIAIFAYLRSIPPVRNAVPPSRVPEEVMDGMLKANEIILAQMQEQAQH